MIDFENASYVELGQVPVTEVSEQLDLLVVSSWSLRSWGLRDDIAFSSKRIIAVDVQGITGKKKDFTSVPFSRIQAFSVATAGTIDLDAELELWFSGLGKVKFELPC